MAKTWLRLQLKSLVRFSLEYRIFPLCDIINIPSGNKLKTKFRRFSAFSNFFLDRNLAYEPSLTCHQCSSHKSITKPETIIGKESWLIVISPVR
ncbi:unnamed protein product [Blepharisma stoltei]|uniref:Uncharacterized protein n=1 Tax=Blepharisma stoltei TaxID=1481888 RepID=A0AAU9KGG4_9CILI|nr:unnamed protein product [Blepharisma stoltei]